LDETQYRPGRVAIPLDQHIGAPAQPVVSVGQQVTVGDLIAEIPDGALGANVHASIAGRVAQVSELAIEIAA
jgi:Na+-translocating ferredoxin:NAD+ oxidoreductase RnfC subunit